MRYTSRKTSPIVGLEPTTTRLRALRSTNWARRASDPFLRQPSHGLDMHAMTWHDMAMTWHDMAMTWHDMAWHAWPCHDMSMTCHVMTWSWHGHACHAMAEAVPHTGGTTSYAPQGLNKKNYRCLYIFIYLYKPIFPLFELFLVHMGCETNLFFGFKICFSVWKGVKSYSNQKRCVLEIWIEFDFHGKSV